MDAVMSGTEEADNLASGLPRPAKKRCRNGHVRTKANTRVRATHTITSRYGKKYTYYNTLQCRLCASRRAQPKRLVLVGED